MKPVIRKRTEIAACCTVVANDADHKADQYRDAARRARRRMNPNEQASFDELKRISAHYRQEATRHIMTAITCGNPVVIVKPL